MIHDTNFFFIKVFKAKYFPNGTVFDAKEKSGSFAWKSILGARHVISLGAKWRIGDGFTARISKDNWLPRVGDGKVVSPVQFLYKDCIVADLLDEDLGRWNS